MTYSSSGGSCIDLLENNRTRSSKETVTDVINSLTVLKLNETIVEDLLTDDEDDHISITDDEEYFTCNDNSIIQHSSTLNFSSIYNAAYECLSLTALKEKCSQLDISITDSEANEIEKLTRDQADSTEWHKLRIGRITASVFKSVCSTNIDKPSISLLTKICYPEKAAFTSKYTEWGRTHEKQALNEFITNMKTHHVNFVNINSGLVVLPKYPYFGASPDGLCCCDCCKEGCIEIKCPYTLKDGQSFDLLTNKTDPFLLKNEGKYILNKKHSYYFQIQMQLFLTKRNYCYFVVWSPKAILQFKVLPDEKFWITHSATAECFFKWVVLPELLGKYFTKPKAEVLKVEASKSTN